MTKIATLTVEPSIATALGNMAIIVVVPMGDRLVKHQQVAHQ
ncbi:hypothetical protein [Coleofasciculus sp. F4-SAH-05]